MISVPKVTYKWNMGETARLFKSEACKDWCYAEARKIADSVNAEAVRFAKTEPKMPPYKASSHRGSHSCVGRVRPSTKQGKAIEYRYGLLTTRGFIGRSQKWRKSKG